MRPISAYSILPLKPTRQKASVKDTKTSRTAACALPAKCWKLSGDRVAYRTMCDPCQQNRCYFHAKGLAWSSQRLSVSSANSVVNSGFSAATPAPTVLFPLEHLNIRFALPRNGSGNRDRLVIGREFKLLLVQFFSVDLVHHLE